MVENEYVEYVNVGAEVGGSFDNTAELKPMKHEQAINGPNAEAWKAEIDNEHNRMVKNKMFEVVKREELPGAARISGYPPNQISAVCRPFLMYPRQKISSFQDESD